MGNNNSMAERKKEEAARAKRFLPNWWINSIYCTNIWTGFWAWMNLSGNWQSRVLKCTVEQTWWEGFIADTVALSAIMSVFLIFAAFAFLKSR